MTDDATTPAGDDRAAPTGPDDSTASVAFVTAAGEHGAGGSAAARNRPDADSSGLFASFDNSSLYPNAVPAESPGPGSGSSSPPGGSGRFGLFDSDAPGGYASSDGSGGYASSNAPGGYPSSDSPGGYASSDAPGGYPSSDGSGIYASSNAPGSYASSGDTDRAGAGASSGPQAPADDAAAPPARPDAAQRQRRRLIGTGIAVAAVLILAVCGGLGAVAAVVSHVANAADERREVRVRTDSACLELERRLNRLAPPGSAPEPGRRAAAIRDENAAVRPFLSEIDQLRGRWPDDDSDDDGTDGRQGWPDGWRQLVDARNAYADALDRQVTNGEPAFFLAPQDRRGRPVPERLQRGPQSCAGAGRRLAAPDL